MYSSGVGIEKVRGALSLSISIRNLKEKFVSMGIKIRGLKEALIISNGKRVLNG